MTCSCLSGGISNPTAPQNASILNTQPVLSTKEWQHLCCTCTELVPIKIQWLTLAMTGSLLVSSFICWALTGPLSIVSLKFTMSSGMGVFLANGTLLRPFAWPFSLSGFVFKSVVICLKQYGPPEETQERLFQGGINLFSPNKPSRV